MSDQLSAARSFAIETKVAVFVDRRYESYRARPLQKLVRAYNNENRRRFNDAAEAIFTDALKRAKHCENLPSEILQAPREKGLALFQEMLRNVIGVFADNSSCAKKKLIERYGSEAFRKLDTTEQLEEQQAPSGVQWSGNAGLATA